MGGLLGGGQVANSSQPTRMTGLKVQTSVYGTCIQIVYGAARVEGDLIWYGDFAAEAVEQESGKGFSQTITTGYTYSASLMIGVCEGLIVDIPRVWSGKVVQEFDSSPFANGVLRLGAYPQDPWPYLTSNHPEEALRYNGLAYVSGIGVALGDSADMPNFNFEVQGRLCKSLGEEILDCNPADVIEDLLTNVHYSGIFSESQLDLVDYWDYCMATGLLISPVFSEQQEAAQSIDQIVKMTNSEIVWSDGRLKVIPYGDESVTGNGTTYSPDMTPVYSLTYDDFKIQQDDPIEHERLRRSDAYNVIRLEYCDRSNDYDPSEVEAKDDASIELYGERSEESEEARFFCVGQIARLAAQLRLQRANVLNRYTFTLGMEYALLEPMDLVSLTDPALGLDGQLVRIKEISEDEEGYLQVIAEEVIIGIGTAEDYNFAVGEGYRHNYLETPGDANPPVIFEPHEDLIAAKGARPGYQLWAAISGESEHFGGAEIYVSWDGGSTYVYRGVIDSPSTQGVLLDDFPTHSDPDESNTLSVDLSMSRGTMTGQTEESADLYITTAIVGDEIIAYSAADLGDEQYQYDLSGYIRRGLFGTTTADHVEGDSFALINDSAVRNAFEYEESLIGKELYIKILAVNTFKLQQQTLDEVEPVTVTPTGISYTVPGRI